jgi:hypothetical protein
MTSSTHITLRRTGLVFATAVLGAVLAGSALAGNGSGLNLPPQAAAGLKASSDNWAAKAKLLDVNGQPRWAAKAKLLDINGRPVHQTPVTSGDPGSFDWADFGIGAGAMLGVLLLATGLLAGAHYGRKSGVRPRPTS